jgi:hypothetical protein
MKKLFITASLLTCCITLFAQVNNRPSFMDFLNKEKPLKSFVPRATVVPKLQIQNSTIDNLQSLAITSKAKLLMVLPNGNKLSVLPQDNMPCIVPDLSQFNMPVATAPNNLDERINVSKGGN